ncbi:MAG: DUF962 domain-containing protein [Halobacteriovoraceae bacterium]|nr:DUF962 domain-containing protein [Halobacteriovoraceae bacterium]
MRSLNSWFDEYSQSHQNPINVLIHKICVPTIMFTVLGLLWSIPSPDIFLSLPLLNWCTIFLLFVFVFYLRLSLKYTLGMFIQTSIMLFFIDKIDNTPRLDLLELSLSIFILAWIGQFIGHKIEGKKPSFFKDLQFLLIGPLWTMRFLYKRFKFDS